MFDRLRVRQVIPAGLMLVTTLGFVVACATGGTPLRPAADAVQTPVAAAAPAQTAVGGTTNATAPAPAIAPAPPAVAAGSGVVSAPAPAIAPAPAAAVASTSASVGAQVLPPVPSPAPASVRGIIVSGSGSATATPDEAIVSAGVQTQGATAQATQSDNNQKMAAVIAAIKALGIADKDIQTTGVSLYPMENQNQFIAGYNATNNVTVVVQNISQAGQVLDAAVTAGANQATSVRFSIKDQAALRNKALAAAAADAKQKADALAGALGLQITGIESVSEQSSGGQILTAPRAFGATAAAAPSVPVEPGQLTVNADVTIVFGY